jgi:hypothetical protein
MRDSRAESQDRTREELAVRLSPYDEPFGRVDTHEDRTVAHTRLCGQHPRLCSLTE